MSMRSPWLCAVLLGSIALFLLPACSDSSDVGLGVGPRSDSLGGGQPQTLGVLPAAVDTTQEVPITGENSREPPVRSDWRFLVGRVQDPVTTPSLQVEAEGYVDFAGRSSLPDAIAAASDADSLTAELRLPVTYVHGIGNAAMPVDVYDLSDEAAMDSARASETFPADMTGPASVDAAEITPTDSLVTIELRQDWIEQNLAVLQNTGDGGLSFEEEFSGFKIVAPNSQAVVGFSSTDATLRLTHVADTVSAEYTALKTFTHVEQQNEVTPPSGYELLRGGVGTGLAMEWAYGEAEFQTEVESSAPGSPPIIDSLPVDTSAAVPLNRAELLVPVDTAELNRRTGADFSRPLPNGYRIVATRHPDPSTPSCSNIFNVIGLATGDRACSLPLVSSAAPGAALVGNDYAFPLFDQTFRRVSGASEAPQPPPFTTFRVFVADRASTGGSGSTLQPGLPTTVPVLVPARAASADPGPPRATLTVTPL